MTDDTTPGNNPSNKEKPRPVFRLFGVVAAILITSAVLLLLQRRSQFQALASDTESQAVPTVAIIHPVLENGTEELVLPGTLQAFVESPIYARTSGYLRKWYHDIGSRVSEGDPLAEIDTPEVDQQLLAARADLATAEANEHLAQITAARYRELLQTDSVSRQEVDNASGDLAAKSAAVQASRANVRRLGQLKSFERVFSPFTGVVTRRNVDVGTLVNAGNGGASQLLFVVAQTDPLRVYVNVPESYAPSMRRGLPANLKLTAFPADEFRGEVVRTADSIDPTTRSLLTEVDVPNPTGALLPGGYAQVHFQVGLPGDNLQVPVNALLFRSEGLRAVVVDSSDHARLQAVTIGRDYGTSLEVLSGLALEDRIVLNPPDALEAGQLVRTKEVGNPLAPAREEGVRSARAGEPTGNSP